MRRSLFLALAALASTSLLATVPAVHAAPPAVPNWITAYSLPAFLPSDTRQWKQERDYAGHTVREVIRLNAAGDRLRVKFTNDTGAEPVVIGRAHIALAGPDGAPVPGTDRELSFGGRQGLFVPVGAPAFSDAVALPAKAFGDVVVSVFFPAPGPIHLGGHLANLKVAPGDATEAAALPNAVSQTGPSFVSRIDVEPTTARHLLVAVGDSITEGACSTPGAHMSWPEQLARRLAASPSGRGWSVANEGISGNRILRDSAGPNLLSRFDRDVLDLPGVSTVILLEGVNDIGKASQAENANEPVSADQLIGAMKQVVARAHARGVRIYGGTILPYEGASYYSSKGEATRQAVNAWIRTGHVFDGVIDFEAATRDPTHPTRLAQAVDSGDHLHPGDAGYTLMAKAVDLALLTGAASPPAAHVRKEAQ